MIEFNQKEIVTKQFNLDFSSAKLSEIKEENGILNLVFKEENLSEQKLDIWELKITNDQLSQVRREIDIHPISAQQLKAIHAKEQEKKEKEAKDKEQYSIKKIRKQLVEEKEQEIQKEDPTKEKAFRPIPAPIVERLPRKEAKPLNWKDKEPEREAKLARKKIDPDNISRLLSYVFKFHQRMVKTDGYSQSHRDKDRNLAYFLKTIAPKSVGLPTLSCQKIYTAQIYHDITKVYRQQWINLCMYFINNGDKSKLPGYLVKHYVD